MGIKDTGSYGEKRAARVLGARRPVRHVDVGRVSVVSDNGGHCVASPVFGEAMGPLAALEEGAAEAVRPGERGGIGGRAGVLALGQGSAPAIVVLCTIYCRVLRLNYGVPGATFGCEVTPHVTNFRLGYGNMWPRWNRSARCGCGARVFWGDVISGCLL